MAPTLAHVCLTVDRRGSAYMALAKYKDALRDFKSVRQLKPKDPDALAKFKAADKEVSTLRTGHTAPLMRFLCQRGKRHVALEIIAASTFR